MVAQRKKRWRFLKVWLVFFLLAGAAGAYMAYDFMLAPNVILKKGEKDFVYIPTGSDFDEVVYILEERRLLRNRASFTWMARLMRYRDQVKPGRYKITGNMNNKELILLLRSGKQTPVRITINNIRFKENLAALVGRHLEADSASLMALLNNREFVHERGYTAENILTLFIPNTYEFYWNTSAEEFIERMEREHARFWNPERKEKARAINLTPAEVSILASIVDQETYKEDEMNGIAGVYLNRLKKGWKLEADPTLIYALGDFSIRRVLAKHKETDSPYNTYRHSGLPPGPIWLPSLAAIDAVLNYQEHSYFFFCAKDDFSGYHCFARTYGEHQINARKFQRELNKRNIRN